MDWGDTSSHNTRKSIVAAEEQTALEDVNHIDDEEKDNENKEGVSDDLNQFLYPKYEILREFQIGWKLCNLWFCIFCN